MFGSLRSRILVILAVLAVSGWYLHQNGLTLGLDLRGGMHLLLEVADAEGTMTAEARADAADRALQVIRTRIDEFGVAEPLIQRSGEDRIIVELPGVQDEERAKAVIQRAAFLEFRLVRDALRLREALPRLDGAVLQAVGDAGGGAAPGDPGGPPGADSGAQGRGPNAPAGRERVSPPPPFSDLLLETGRPGELAVVEADVPRLRAYLELPEVRRALPRGVAVALGNRPVSNGAEAVRPVYVLEDRAFMTGEALEDAAAGRDPEFNLPIVSFELNRRAARTFERVTGENIGRRMAILLDGEVVSAPKIRNRIGASGRIEMGRAPMTEARDLALILRAGALPAPLGILEERTVGPALGADAIERARRAGAVAIALVVGIMVAYYRVAGLLAVAALAAYALIVLGGLASFGATLTVPGIAGLTLSLGMAVDANVLIFERIREELRAGRTRRPAIDAGFRNAMSAIIDANLTTLATALILFQFGTGPVRGFAVTLSVGIIASFFSAVYITRTLFTLGLERREAPGPMSI